MNRKALIFGLSMFGVSIINGMIAALLFVAKFTHAITSPPFPIFLLLAAGGMILGATFIANAFPDGDEEEPTKPEKPANGLPSPPNQ